MLFPLDPDAQPYGYAPADPTAPPAVSIVTPCFNTPAALFAETIQSVLRQSLQQWEWIVVDDGTNDPDAMRGLAALASSPDARIHLIRQPNRGLPAARNAGARAARAALIFFLDSDDLLAPTALEKLAWSLVGRPNSAFAGAWAAVFGAERWRWNLGFDSSLRFPTVNTLTANSLVRAAVFNSLGGFDEARRAGYEDYEFWVRAAAAGHWGHDVREPLLWVRRKQPEQYRGYNWAFQRRRSAFAEVRAELQARYPALFRDGPPALPGPSALDAHVVLRDGLPFANRLRPGPGRQLLIVLPAIRVGGADRFALDLIASLVTAGDRVSVVITRPDIASTWMDELLKITPDVFDLAAFLAPGDYPRFLHYLVESRGITTALISNSLLAYQLLPYLRAHCPSLAIVDYQHNLQPQRAGGFPRVGVEHRALIDLHITSSGYLRDWMQAEGIDSGRLSVCATSVDVHYWSPDPGVRAKLRAELGLDEATALVLFVGRLTAQKRPDLLVAVLRDLHTSAVPFAAALVGGGEDEGWVRATLRQHGLDGAVRLLGEQPRERVRELMRAADILLLPSAYEGIALTLFEAMACEVVPVAADVGGQRELVTPVCGLLIPPGGDELGAYVSAIQALIADPERRRAMARAGRARVVAEFNAAQLVGRMQALFDRALALSRERPQPRVDPGVALAAATLAMEHQQLDARLRALPPVRLLLALRWSAARRWLGPLARARGNAFRLARRLYRFQRLARERAALLRGKR